LLRFTVKLRGAACIYYLLFIYILLYPPVAAGFCNVPAIVHTAQGGNTAVGATFEHQVVLAKVKLLPCPADEDSLGGPQLVNFAAYKEPAGEFTFVTPRRMIKHAVVVPQFVGKGVEVAEDGIFLQTRK